MPLTTGHSRRGTLQHAPFPDGVEAHKREMYLSDADFEEAFGMTKGEWAKMPSWKKSNMKKKLSLF